MITDYEMKDFIKINDYIELYETCKKDLQSLDTDICSVLGLDAKEKSLFKEFLKLSKPGNLQDLALCLYRLKEVVNSKNLDGREEILKSLALQVKDWIDVAEKIQYDKSELDEIRELFIKLKKDNWLKDFLQLSRLDNPIELLWHLKGYKATKKADLSEEEKNVVLAKYEEQIESWLYRAKENEYKGNRAILKDKERDSLRKAVDSSSGSNKTFFISYLSILLYLVITVSGVTDEQFLLNRPVKLPWLNIEIPLFGFFLFAPFILFATHLNLLYNLTKHFDLIHKFGELCGVKDMQRLERFQLSPFLFNYLVLHEYEPEEKRYQKILSGLLKVLVWLLLVFTPILTLVFIQVRFSDYQDMSITLWHFFLLLLDLSFASYFFWNVFAMRTESKVSKTRLAFHSIVVLFLLITSFLNLYYLNRILSLRGESNIPTLANDFKNSFRFRLFPRLEIRGKTLVSSQPSDLLLLGGYLSGKEDIEDFKSKHTKGIDVKGRNLIYSVFIDCNVTNANFKKANLQGAVFYNTNIERANFFNAEISGAEPAEILKNLKAINKSGDQ